MPSNDVYTAFMIAGFLLYRGYEKGGYDNKKNIQTFIHKHLRSVDLKMSARYTPDQLEKCVIGNMGIPKYKRFKELYDEYSKVKVSFGIK